MVLKSTFEKLVLEFRRLGGVSLGEEMLRRAFCAGEPAWAKALRWESYFKKQSV